MIGRGIQQRGRPPMAGRLTTLRYAAGLDEGSSGRGSLDPCMIFTRRSFFLSTLVLAVGLHGSSAAVRAQEILRIPYVADIGTFDPDNGFETGAMSAIDNVYEGLVEYEPGSTKIVGLLAKSWEISDDGLTYTFHLVDGVKFHDGTPFNAAAVIKAFERRSDR